MNRSFSNQDVLSCTIHNFRIMCQVVTFASLLTEIPASRTSANRFRNFVHSIDDDIGP